MKSYVKVYGPPLLKAIKALEKVAIDMPDVSIMDFVISSEIPPSLAKDIGGISESSRVVSNYFFRGTNTRIPVERSRKIISKSGESLGEYDFFFEWFKKPTMDELSKLIEKIDEAFLPLGVKYTLTTK